MVIKCKINGNIYILEVLVSKNEKLEGLKRYPSLDSNRGVIFVYERDSTSGYDFSEIGYGCKIFFLDSDFKLIYKEETTMFQERIVRCPSPFRYVIEVSN